MNPFLKNSQTAKTCDSVVLFTRRETHAVKKKMPKARSLGIFFNSMETGWVTFDSCALCGLFRSIFVTGRFLK